MNLILERVKNICDAVHEAHKQAISFKKLISTTRRKFRQSDVDIVLKTKKDNSLGVDEFYILAFYDPYNDYHNEVSVEVIVYHNFGDTDQFKSTQTRDFLVQIFDAVVHELRHQLQSRSRGCETYSEHCTEPFSKYIADPDELDAYSFSIAVELLRVMHPTKAKRYMSKISIMSKMKINQKFISPNLNSYIAYYGKDPLIKKVAKKVYIHLETIDKNLIF